MSEDDVRRFNVLLEDIQGKVKNIGSEYAKNESGVIEALKDVGSGEE